MAIVNLQGLIPKTPEEELLESVPGLNISPLPSGIDLTPPPPNVPRFRGYGDFLAQRGGFAPEDLRTREELMGMTQAEVDEYQRQRRKARRAGIGETLMRVGQAFQGKDATALAMQREQNRRLIEQQAQLGASIDQLNIPEAQKTLLKSLPPEIQYKALFPSAEQGSLERFSIYSNKAGRTIGSVLKGDTKRIAEVQADPDLQIVPLSAPKDQAQTQPTIYQVVDAKDNRVPGGIVTIDEFREKQKAGIYPSTHTIVRIPVGSEAPGLGKIELFSEENKPIAEKWEATNTLLNSLQNYTNELNKEDAAALTGLGAGAKFATSIIQNTKGFLKLASQDTKSFYNQAVSDNSFVTIEGKDFATVLQDVQRQYGVNESQVRDLAYLFAAARGQEGRGLSDKDYENALQIVSGGVGKEGKIAVVESVYNRLSGEVSNSVNRRIALLEDQRSLYPEQQSYFDIQIGQLRSLQNATPLEAFINPLQQQTPTVTTPTSNIDDILAKYPPRTG